MATVYLNASTGSDSNTYAQAQNPATPWLTFGKVNTSATTGDTVQVSAGTYTLAQVNWTKSFTIIGATPVNGMPVSIVSGGGGTLSGGYAGVWENTASGVTLNISNLRFTNATLGWALLGSISGGGGTYNVTNCVFDTFVMTTQYCPIIGAGNSATSFNVNGCLFYNITQTSQNQGGIFALFNSAGTFNHSVINCTYYQSATSYPIALFWNTGSATRNLIIKNNIAYTASSIGYGVATGNGLTVTYNNNCAYGFTGVPSGSNNITSDPLFIDMANSNFNLRSSSPCVGTGTLI